MTAGASDGGHYTHLRERQERIAAANPHLAPKITGKTPINVALPKPKALFAKGRYISPSLTCIMEMVAKQADLSVEAIRGAGRKHVLINARFCIANLAEEFAPRLSALAVDDGMLRGEGMCAWYRLRHRDRLELYPDYMALFERCQAELRTGARP